MNLNNYERPMIFVSKWEVKMEVWRVVERGNSNLGMTSEQEIY